MSERLQKNPGEFNSNDEIINDIVDKVAGLMATNPRVRTIDFVTAEEPVPDVDDEDAMYDEYSMRCISAQAIDKTKTAACMQWAEREIESGVLDTSMIDSWQSVKFPALAFGEHSSFELDLSGDIPNKTVTIDYTVVELENEGVWKEIDVAFSDGTISEIYGICINPDGSNLARLHVQSSNDELLEKIAVSYGPDVLGALAPLMVGMVSEDEMEYHLYVLRQQYASEANIQEIDALLEEVRERYIAVRQAHEMSEELQLDEVSLQELTELRTFIDTL